jgi:hypothetical protein
MLPNVRLMIAATFAAVLMLIFGFGMFATFRVSHAPLERVASALPLHLFTAQDTAPLVVTAAAPFNNRLETVGPGTRSVAALAYAAPDPAEQPELKVVAPATENPEQTAAQPTPEPAIPMPENADVPSSSQRAASSEAVAETKPGETLAAVTPSAPSADPQTITLAEPLIAAPPPEPAQPFAQAEDPEVVALAALTIEPPPALPDIATSAAEKAEKKAKHAHAAARTHRIHKPRVVAEASAFGTQTTFQTGLGWWTPQEPQKAAAKIPRPKIAAKTPEGTTSSTGGPFVSAPKQPPARD